MVRFALPLLDAPFWYTRSELGHADGTRSKAHSEAKAHFAGGAYAPILRRLEAFSERPLREALEAHERHARLLLELDEKVGELVAKLKARGLLSLYLRTFVVARINPLRWIQGEPPPLGQVLQTMRTRAERFSVDRVRQEDLAGVAGAPEEEA